MYPTLYHFFLDTFGWSIEWLKPIYTLGFFVSLAWIIAGSIFYRTSKLASLDKVRLLGLVIIASTFGATGLAYLEGTGTYHNHSGFTYYGGLLLAGLLGLTLLRLTKRPMIRTLNEASIPLMLGYGIGRLGCHFSGDGDWGIVNTLGDANWLPDWAWNYRFPGNVLGFYNEEPIRFLHDFSYENEYSFELVHPVFPTSLYEAILAAFGAIALIRLKNTPRQRGALFPWFLSIAGFFRLGIECIRNTPKYDFGIRLSMSQFIALGLLIVGSFWLMRNQKQRKERKQRIVNN